MSLLIGKSTKAFLAVHGLPWAMAPFFIVFFSSSLAAQSRILGVRPISYPSNSMDLHPGSPETANRPFAPQIRITGFRPEVQEDPRGGHRETNQPLLPNPEVRITGISPSNSAGSVSPTPVTSGQVPPSAAQGMQNQRGSSPMSGFRIEGLANRNISLIEAVQSSLTNKKVIHSLGAQVIVEPTTQLDPLIVAQQVGIAESRFDPTLSSTVGSNKYNLPPSSFTQEGIPVPTKRNEIDFITRLSKEWATGATTSVGYEPSVAYLFFPGGNPNGFNPNNEAGIVFQGVQPLLRGAGRRNNLATIRIAQDRADQSRLNVESRLQSQLVDMEKLYWDLHASNVQRAAIVEAIALSKKMLEIERFRYEAKRIIYADVARVGVKLENLTQQRIDSEQRIQKLSLQLSQMAGFAFDPSTLLIPNDPPEFRIQSFDLDSELAIARERNPDLLIRRYELSVLANQLQVAKNQLRPQLDLRSSLRSGGLSDDLGVALIDMSRFEFLDFSVGLAYSRQVGNRNATSKYRQSTLESARTHELLAALEQNVAFTLAESINSVQLAFAAFESALRQLEEAKEWVKLAKIRYENPPEELGQEGLLIALVDYQSALQSRVDAVTATASALARYNTDLAIVEQLKGTLLERWGITVASDPDLAESHPADSVLQEK